MTTPLSFAVTPASLLNDCILPANPRPKDPFAEALWCTELETALTELSSLFNHRFHRLISRIRDEGLTSDDYTLTCPTTPVRRVNIDLLRSEQPDIFSRVVHLKATDAERILSRQTLYRLCRETADSRIRAMEQVNLGDLKTVLKDREITPYIIVEEKPCRPVITRMYGEEA